MQREQLEKQHCDDVQTKPYTSFFRAAAVRNVIPDPDLPQGCASNSSEYVKTWDKIMVLIFSCFVDKSLFFSLKLSPAGAKPRVASEDRDSAVTDLLQNLSFDGLSPQWIRPAPPRLPILEGEASFSVISEIVRQLCFFYLILFLSFFLVLLVYSLCGLTLTTTMNYCGTIACVLTPTEERHSEI